MAKRFDLTKQGSLSAQPLIRAFFGGNASFTIIILALICFFLAREAFWFFPQYRADLEMQRQTGAEPIAAVDQLLSEQRQLINAVAEGRLKEEQLSAQSLVKRRQAYNQLAGYLDGRLVDRLDAWYEAVDALDEASPATQPQMEAELAAVEAQYFKEVQQTLERTDWSQFVIEPADKAWLIEALGQRPPSGDPPALLLALEDAIAESLGPWDQAQRQFTQATAPLRESWESLRPIAETNLSLAKNRRSADNLLEEALEAEKEGREAQAAEIRGKADQIASGSPDYAELTAPIAQTKALWLQQIEELKQQNQTALEALPASDQVKSAELSTLIKEIQGQAKRTAASADSTRELLSNWQWDKPVALSAALSGFFLGGQWQTNAAMQDLYGLLPLFAGSFIISLIALAIAVPLSIGGAIYVNQLGSAWEQSFFKPILEFIQAIPSVVLGFFGIAVLGSGLMNLSQVEFLSWIPGFPLESRLNMLLAGILLALMAIPTIFTLAEDAINNVPQAYRDASYALGGSRLQTTLRVITPAAFSGILAAILLGFGRVIGETMVVLLVSGGRIAIPDFTEGLAALFQPAHTMTGIIAQETGEVSKGTLHYRALFMVAMVLFTLSLGINYSAQAILRRMQRHG